MGSEKKFSLDDKYQLDEIKKQLENASDMLDIVIKVSEKDKNGLKLELEGRMSVEELSGYIDERKRALHSSYQKDELTGRFNSDYFEKRMATIDRSSVLPVAVINFNINSCQITDGVCDADLTLFLDCLHYKKKKVIVQTDKYRMHVRKKLKAVTDLGFSFAAVSCPSCGASFDARNVKACPFCNSAYLHEEHDWVMTDLH